MRADTSSDALVRVVVREEEREDDEREGDVDDEQRHDVGEGGVEAVVHLLLGHRLVLKHEADLHLDAGHTEHTKTRVWSPHVINCRVEATAVFARDAAAADTHATGTHNTRTMLKKNAWTMRMKK